MCLGAIQKDAVLLLASLSEPLAWGLSRCGHTVERPMEPMYCGGTKRPPE